MPRRGRDSGSGRAEDWSVQFSVRRGVDWMVVELRLRGAERWKRTRQPTTSSLFRTKVRWRPWGEDDVFVGDPGGGSAELEPGVAEGVFGVEAGGVGTEDEVVVVVPLSGDGAGPEYFEVDVGGVVGAFDEDVAVVGGDADGRPEEDEGGGFGDGGDGGGKGGGYFVNIGKEAG